MSDLFENIELQMQEDAKEKNPRSAILASQMETEKRFGNFIDENFNRVSIIEKEIKEVTDKYAFQYEVDPQLVYEETVSYLTKNAIAFETVEDEESGVLPGIRESLNLMTQNGFDELARKWEDRVSSMSVEEQIDIYPDVIDSFVEAVESSPQTEMWEMDPNQYNEWDKTSSAHKDLSDEELLNKIKEEVSKLKKLDDPVSDHLEELHQELWDRSGHGDKWRNRKKDEKEGEEKTAAGNYVAYQIRGNDHFLCPHCAQEMTGEDLNWEDNLAGISNNEMQDIAKYTGHSSKCDQCGMDLFENHPREASASDGFMSLGHKLVEMAEQAGHSKLADKWVKDWMNPETSAEGAHEKIAFAARQLWEVLKGDRRPEVREFYSNNKDELVDLMTQANALAYEVDPSRVSKREASIAIAIGLEEAFIHKQAAEIYGGWLNDRINERVPDDSKFFGGGLKYDIPEKTWHDFIMRSDLYGNKGYPLKDAPSINGLPNNKVPLDEGGEPPTNRRKNVVDFDEQPTSQIPIPNSQNLQSPGYVLTDEEFDDLAEKERRQERANMDFNKQQQWLLPGRKRKLPMPGAMAASGEIRSPLEGKLVDLYVNKGLSEKYASIIVESIGEMAQLQVDAPGLPVADSECETINPDKEIGGAEGDKYQNWNVADKQKALDAEHQDFTDFGEPVREFVQPGGEAPYSENTKKKIDQGAESVDMNKKKVKQEDNAPKN